MGKINITRLGGLGSHANTLVEYDYEVSEQVLDSHLTEIAAIFKVADDCVCYVLGMGGQSKATYDHLKKESGVELIWDRSILSGPLRVLSFFIASHAGLVKVLDADMLPSVVKKVCHLSMAGVYIFDKSMEQEFVANVIKNPLPEEFDFGVKKDPGYFFYIVDADNPESSTGIFEIVSYGKTSDFAGKWKSM